MKMSDPLESVQQPDAMRTKNALLITVLTLVLLSCAWIALYRLDRGPLDHLGIGFCLGSLFGHSTLASGWMALGSSGWLRLALALAWLLAFPLAFFINSILYGNRDSGTVILFSTCMIFLLVSLAAWPMRFWFGLRIRKLSCDQSSHRKTLAARQFGIRDLMIVTTSVAVIIGSGRLMLPYLRKWLVFDELAIFAFLVVAACVICIPLCFSILSMRKPVLPTLFTLAFAALATYFEMPLLNQVGLPRGGPDWLHLTLINAFSLLPVAIVSVALRYAGYQLSTTKQRT